MEFKSQAFAGYVLTVPFLNAIVSKTPKQNMIKASFKNRLFLLVAVPVIWIVEKLADLLGNNYTYYSADVYVPGDYPDSNIRLKKLESSYCNLRKHYRTGVWEMKSFDQVTSHVTWSHLNDDEVKNDAQHMTDISYCTPDMVAGVHVAAAVPGWLRDSLDAVARAAASIPQALQENTHAADSNALAQDRGMDRLAAALQRGLSLSDKPAADWVTSLETATSHAHQALDIQPPAAPRARGGASQASVLAARSRAEVDAFNAQADHFSSPLIVFCSAEELATRAARMAGMTCGRTPSGSADINSDAEAESSPLPSGILLARQYADRCRAAPRVTATAAAVIVPQRMRRRCSFCNTIHQHAAQQPQAIRRWRVCASKRSGGLVSTIAGRWRPRLHQAMVQPWRRSIQDTRCVCPALSLNGRLQFGKIREKVSVRCTSCSAWCAAVSSPAQGLHSRKQIYLGNLRTQVRLTGIYVFCTY